MPNLTDRGSRRRAHFGARPIIQRGSMPRLASRADIHAIVQRLAQVAYGDGLGVGRRVNKVAVAQVETSVRYVPRGGVSEIEPVAGLQLILGNSQAIRCLVRAMPRQGISVGIEHVFYKAGTVDAGCGVAAPMIRYPQILVGLTEQRLRIAAEIDR